MVLDLKAGEAVARGVHSCKCHVSIVIFLFLILYKKPRTNQKLQVQSNLKKSFVRGTNAHFKPKLIFSRKRSSGFS